MSTQAHTRLMTMLDERELEFAAADPLRVCRLRREAEAHLVWARASYEGADLDGAFRLAYRACAEYAVALLLSAGLRPVDPEERRLVFRAVATMAPTYGMRRTVRHADELRHVSTAAEAGRHELERGDALEALRVGESLGRHVTHVVEQRYPGMLGQERVS